MQSIECLESPQLLLPVGSPSRVLTNTERVVTLANDDDDDSAFKGPANRITTTTTTDHLETTVFTAADALIDHIYCRPPWYSKELPDVKVNGEVNEYMFQVIDPQTGRPIRLPVTMRFRVKQTIEEEGASSGNNLDDDKLECLCSDCTEGPEEEKDGDEESLEEASAKVNQQQQQLSLNSEVATDVEMKKETNMENYVEKLEESNFITTVASTFSSSSEQQQQQLQLHSQPSISKTIQTSVPTTTASPVIIFSDGSRTNVQLYNNFLPYSNNTGTNNFSKKEIQKKAKKAKKTKKKDDALKEKEENGSTGLDKKKPKKDRTFSSHICWHCNKAFANGNNLQKHLYKVKGIMPYSCLKCGAGFLLKKELKAHFMLCQQETALTELEAEFQQLNEFPTLKTLTVEESMETIVQLSPDLETTEVAITAADLLNSFA